METPSLTIPVPSNLFCATAFGNLPQPGNDGPSERTYQVAVMSKLAHPVLTAASEGKLRKKILKGLIKPDATPPLEALARTLCGIAPWLELGPGNDKEGQLRAKYIQMATKGIHNASNPQSPDFMNFNQGMNPLVDVAFLAHGLLRAPQQLWGNLDASTQEQVIAALKSSRVIVPANSNWLLFSAIVEAALLEFTDECNMAPIETAVKMHLIWYKGDGTYGDGEEFQWDYYNSFVIQPMLWEVLEVCERKNRFAGADYSVIQARARRYAEVQERMISPEGTFPIIGRSSCYRFAAFQTLSLVALYHQLPPSLPLGGVRAALNTVIHHMIEAPNTFDENGWLTIGVVGSQPNMADHYISTGSLYLCTTGLLQLGLPAHDPFWTAPDQPWTQKRIWSGENLHGDHALKE